MMSIPFFARTSAPVQTAMLVEMIRLLQQCQEVVTLPDVGDEPDKPSMTAEAFRLEKMGFTNAKPLADHRQRLKQYEEDKKQWGKRVRARANVYVMRLTRILAIETLVKARETFGDDTLLIPYSDFERLMRKYNLVCGTFDRYKGDIPSDKVSEIERLQFLLRDKGTPKYINRLTPIKEIRFDEDVLFESIPGHIKRFPFAKVDGRSIWSDRAKDMRGNVLSNRHTEYRYGSEVSLFICAPSRDMKKLRTMKMPRITSVSDPFICAHTDYGILVFTRWGEEADDKVIRKYEKASQWLDKARQYIGSQKMPQRRGGFID